MSVTEITSDQQFTDLIATGAPVLVDFYAQWCGPCKKIAPHLVTLSEQYPLIKFYKLDIDRLSTTSESQKITSMPTFKLYVDGKVAKMVVGAAIDRIRSALDEVYEIQGFSKDAAAPAAASAPAATTSSASTTDSAGTAAPAAAPAAPKAAKVTELTTEDEFRGAIQQPSCVVDFFAQWCGPCKQLAPYFKTLAGQYPNVNFVKIDFDDFEELAEEFDVASLPTLVFFKGGKKIHMHVGVSKEKIATAFAEHFGAPQ